jgi:hypothetical protein
MIDIQLQAAITNLLNNEMIPRVNAIAQDKIYEILPAWKQANYTARVTQLNFDASSQGRPYTQDELNEISVMSGYWQNIEAVRSASNMHCANLQALTTIEDVQNYDMSVGWP